MCWLDGGAVYARIAGMLPLPDDSGRGEKGGDMAAAGRRQAVR